MAIIQMKKVRSHRVIGSRRCSQVGVGGVPPTSAWANAIGMALTADSNSASGLSGVGGGKGWSRACRCSLDGREVFNGHLYHSLISPVTPAEILKGCNV